MEDAGDWRILEAERRERFVFKVCVKHLQNVTVSDASDDLRRINWQSVQNTKLEQSIFELTLV